MQGKARHGKKESDLQIDLACAYTLSISPHVELPIKKSEGQESKRRCQLVDIHFTKSKAGLPSLLP